MSEQPSVQNIQQPPEAPSLVWDDSAMQTHYANVCNVMGTREEMALLFGAHQTWQEVRVALSNRIVMNPYAAKRLHALLEIALKEYETRYGELKL